MKQFYNILPDLRNQIGHVHQYALSTQKAVERIGWTYAAWIPRDCEMESLPHNWSKTLPSSNQCGKKKFIDRFLEPLSYFCAFRKAIGKINQNQETLFFLEHFRIPQLFALLVALLFAKFPFQIWLLHRYATEQMCCGGKLHRALYKTFERLHKVRRIYFFSDSEPLSREQSKFFRTEVTTLPIPHAQTKSTVKFPKEPESIYCWWPGGAARESKGLKEIRSFSEFLQRNRTAIKLILARNGLEKGIQKSESLILVEDSMERETYEKWIHTADIALLPYSPTDYRLSTSGIFVEAISNGLIPVTTKNTWMAYELQKYDLSELVIDWTVLQLAATIESITKDPNIRKKIDRMQKAYNNYHHLEQFTQQLLFASKSSSNLSQ